MLKTLTTTKSRARHLHPAGRSETRSRLSLANGFALPNVLALSMVIIMFATGLLSAMMPIYQRTGATKNANTARAVAEAALDYVIGRLNTGLAAGVIDTTYDPGTAAGSSKLSSIDPIMTLGFTFGNNTVPQINILVENLPTIENPLSPPYPSDPATPLFKSQFSNKSILYDPSLTSLSYQTNCFLRQPGSQDTQGASYANPYRRVTVTVILGSVIKNVRVILQPIVTASNTSTTAGAGFPFALFGTQRVELVGQAATTSYNSTDPRLYADIGTFGATNQVGTGSLTRGVAQGGYQHEFPNPVAFQTQQIQATMTTWSAAPVAQAPWVQIMGNVFSNGDTTGYWPRSPATGPFANPSGAQPFNNVFGLPDGTIYGAPDGVNNANTQPVPVTGNGWSGGITTSYQQYAKPQLPAVPQAASGAMNLGSITLGNGQTLQVTSSVSTPVLTGNAQKIPPGDYIVNTVTLSGNAQINIDAGAGQTRFFLQGANGGTTAMSVSNTSSINMNGITASTNTNTTGNNGVAGTAGASQLAITPTSQITETAGNANQLQLFYGGTQNIFLLGNERMVIYAPNATVNIGSQPVSNPANFYGAIVAGVARVMSSFSSGAGAFMHYDYNLYPRNMSALIDPVSIGAVPAMVTGSRPLITGYRAVTWQEAVIPSTNLSQVRWY